MENNESSNITNLQPNLYEACLAANLTLDNHESDLYIMDCSAARDILERYRKTYYVFKSESDGHMWLEVPFAYIPFWKKAASQ